MAELREREVLLERIRAYVDKHGITHLTIERLATALALSVSELRAYFDTKEDVIVALIAEDRVRQRKGYAQISADPSMGPLERSRAVWNAVADAPNESRLMFEAIGLGMRDPAYAAFIHGTDDWLRVSQEVLEREGFSKRKAAALATLALAVHRGAMMDVCATGERDRVDAAMEMWLRLVAGGVPAHDA